jgi:hypothetical protein
MSQPRSLRLPNLVKLIGGQTLASTVYWVFMGMPEPPHARERPTLPPSMVVAPLPQ